MNVTRQEHLDELKALPVAKILELPGVAPCLAILERELSMVAPEFCIVAMALFLGSTLGAMTTQSSINAEDWFQRFKIFLETAREEADEFNRNHSMAQKVALAMELDSDPKKKPTVN